MTPTFEDIMDQIEEFKSNLLLDILMQLPEEQQKFYHRLYPDGPQNEADYRNSIRLITASLRKAAK
mgnify:CR=1 FL=1